MLHLWFTYSGCAKINEKFVKLNYANKKVYLKFALLSRYDLEKYLILMAKNENIKLNFEIF